MPKMAHFLEVLSLGDAINDVQTTSDGHICVSYFDEGVFGTGIGTNGFVCFDSDGKDIFRFAEFADRENLPHIDDCYALNVFQNEIWLSYYSNFPLVCLSDLELRRSWEQFGSFSAFAIRGEKLLALPSYRSKTLAEINFSDRTSIQVDPIDEHGTSLASFRGRLYEQRFAGADEQTMDYYKPFCAVARGADMYLHTEKALFRVP